MPLTIAEINEELTVYKVFTEEKIKHHLGNLGIFVGSQLSVVGQVNGDIIVKVKEGRVAINKQLANKILVR